MRSIVISLPAALLLFAGCHTAGRKSPQAAAVISATPAPAQITEDEAIGRAHSGVAGAPALPIRSTEEVRQIELAPYEDENGNLYGPQTKYEVVRRATWNMAAARNPQRAYVPLESIPEPPSILAPLNTANSGPKTAGQTILEAYHIEDAQVLCLMEYAQEPLARAAAEKTKGQWLPIFDDDLGWLLIPAAQLQGPPRPAL